MYHFLLIFSISRNFSPLWHDPKNTRKFQVSVPSFNEVSIIINCIILGLPFYVDFLLSFEVFAAAMAQFFQPNIILLHPFLHLYGLLITENGKV